MFSSLMIRSMTVGKLKASYSGIKRERADDLISNHSFGDIDIKEVVNQKTYFI